MTITRTLGAIVLLLLILAGAAWSKRPSRSSALEQRAAQETSASPTPAVPSSPSGNLLLNPSFENDKAPWFSMPSWGTSFSLSTTVARTGKQSAKLILDSREASPSATAQVLGVVQELSPQIFPKTLSGSYYVENWQPSAAKQYLQAVVIVFGAKNAPQLTKGIGNHQIRFLLGGIASDPFEIRNAKFVFHQSESPKEGEWVPFTLDLHEEFQKAWGSVPQDFTSLRIFFEVRTDQYKPTDGRAQATVYVDDLSIHTDAE